LVRLWSLPIKRELVTFTLRGNFGAAQFSPDGRVLAIHDNLRNNLLLRANSLRTPDLVEMGWP
jgi:hypothetical protein